MIILVTDVGCKSYVERFKNVVIIVKICTVFPMKRLKKDKLRTLPTIWDITRLVILPTQHRQRLCTCMRHPFKSAEHGGWKKLLSKSSAKMPYRRIIRNTDSESRRNAEDN